MAFKPKSLRDLHDLARGGEPVEKEHTIYFREEDSVEQAMLHFGRRERTRDPYREGDEERASDTDDHSTAKAQTNLERPAKRIENLRLQARVNP